MAYDVSLKTAAFDVTKKDVEFHVKHNGAMLGRLLLSKGGVEWVPKDHEKGHHLKWREFGALLEENGEKR